MIDFLNQNNRNHYNPNEYIATKSGSVLAFMKILEAIAAAIAFIFLFVGTVGISTALNNFFLELSQTLSAFLPPAMVQTAGFLSKIPLLIPPFLLLLVILDGIGVFMMRYANRGESLVNLVHFIRWIFSIIEIVLFLAFIIRSSNGVSQLNEAVGGSAGFLASVGAFGLFIYPILALYFGVLLFKCRYHGDICTVLRTVHEEKRTGHLALVKPNHLLGRTGWLAWGSGIIFVISVYCLVYPLITHKKLIPDESWSSISNLSPLITQSIFCFLCFLVFLKYLSLRICVRDFQKRHEYQKRKKFGFIVIVLIIILCIVVYAIGKNHGINNAKYQKSIDNVYIARTSTQVISIIKDDFTATPTSHQKSLPTPTATIVSTKSASINGGVDPDLKEFLDGYEKFMDEYVTFMKRYISNPTDLTLLSQYSSMLSELEKYSEAADRYDAKESEMSAADLAYYTATMLRINNKMLSVY